MPRATGKPTCYDKPQVSSMFRLAMKRVAQEREARSAAGVRFDKTDERDVFEAQLLSVFCADEKLPSGRQLDRVAANNLWRDAKHCLMLLRQGRNPFGPGLKAHCAHCRCRGTLTHTLGGDLTA